MVYGNKQLEELATETSDAERRAASAERELRDWKTAQFMEEHLGDEYEGLIISVQKYGCFVELFEIFVEGLLPINALEEAAGTRCIYREHDHAIVAVGGAERSRSGRGAAKAKPRMWGLGDRVRVRAERIDPMRHRVEFALLDWPELVIRREAQTWHYAHRDGSPLLLRCFATQRRDIL